MTERVHTRATIRVLVVDDSALVRQLLLQAISLDPRLEVVGVARNGRQAVDMASELLPDVVTLDIEMPELNGLDALPLIRGVCEARVVMLSAADDSETVYQALAAGAVDFLPKPKGRFAMSVGQLCEQLAKAIKVAYRVPPGRIMVDHDGIARMVKVIAERAESDDQRNGSASPLPRKCVIAVAIAASTGGPPALEKVLSNVPSTLNAAILIVQHLPRGFSSSLARRLSRAGECEVVEAESGMVLKPGRAYLAPFGAHMLVEEHGSSMCVALDADSPSLHGVCPAADYLFHSVADVFGQCSVGVVLTGMGSDGARGLRAIRDAGGATVVQNEDTSIVWGMPGAAIRERAATRTTSIDMVAADIRRAVKAREVTYGRHDLLSRDLR